MLPLHSFLCLIRLHVGDGTGLVRGPLEALVVSGHEGGEGEDDHVLGGLLLSGVGLGLGGPVEELDDVLGLLGDGGGGTVLVLDSTVVERRGHGDGAAGEVRVVVEAGHHGLAGRGVAVAGEEVEEVVLPGVAGLDHEAEVRGECTAVGGAAGLVVGVGHGEGVGELAGPLEHFSLVVRSVDEVDLGGHGHKLVGGVGHADQFTVVNALEGVARGAHLAVDLEATAEGTAVIGGEEAQVLPGEGLGVHHVVRGECYRGGSGKGRGEASDGSTGRTLTFLPPESRSKSAERHLGRRFFVVVWYRLERLRQLRRY